MQATVTSPFTCPARSAEHRLLQLLEQFDHAIRKLPADGGKVDLACGPMEKPYAERSLKHFDAA
jgi:hypothetical protein